MIVGVQCYAGRKADERPVRFPIGDRDHIIEEIVEPWHGPDDSFYRVRADDGKGTCRVEIMMSLAHLTSGRTSEN